MSRLRMAIVCVILGVGFLISPVPFSYAKDNVEEQSSIEVNLSFDDSMVDYPLEQVKRKKIALEYTGKFFLINHIEDDDVKLQVIDEDDAYELGFVDDILDNIPDEVNPSFEVLPNDKPIVALDKRDNGYRYKQVISEDEIDKLKAIIEEREKSKSEGEINQVFKDVQEYEVVSTEDSKTTTKDDLKDKKAEMNDLNNEKNDESKSEKGNFNYCYWFSFLLIIILVGYIIKKNVDKKKGKDKRDANDM